MDDLVVIILTLIIAVVGALGQIKKKRAAPASPEGQEKPGNFWEMLEEEMEYPRQPEQPEIFQEIDIAPEAARPVEQPRYVEEGGSVMEGKTDKQTSPPMATVQKKKPKLDFSLRKAVIYSEILNRKYT